MQPISNFVNGYHDTGDQLREHIRRRADEAFARLDATKAALTSKHEVAERIQQLEESFLTALGGLPPLGDHVPAQLTGTLDGGDFIVEKLLLETLPEVYVSANLYLPKNIRAKIPGVLFLCGHAEVAKAYERYQEVCRALVRSNMAVLAVDPVGQGERMQYIDPATGRQLIRWGTIEHSHAGFQCHVAGFSIARYFIADAIQALTYLASRPEVDETKLGATGNSGGGTQSSYLTFFDRRLAASAPCTYITSRDAYMATGQAHDSEQNLFGAITSGIDYDDLLVPHAPKPLLIGAVASDFFCIEGTLQSYQNLRRIYDIHEATDNLYCIVSPGIHQYSPILRDQVTRFFRHHLLGEAPTVKPGLTSFADPLESPLKQADLSPSDQQFFSPEELQVTKSGQVVLDFPQSKRIFDLNLQAWQEKKRSLHQSADALKKKLNRLHQAVLASRPKPPLWVREIQSGIDEKTSIRWAHRFTLVEPRVVMPMIELSMPDTDLNDSITVAAFDDGTNATDSRKDQLIELVQTHRRVLLFDPRGVGQARQRPINARPEGIYDTTYRLNYDAMMLRDSLFAMRCFDTYRVLEYARRIAPTVDVFGEGTAGIILLAAAVLDGHIRSAEFEGLIGSFEEIVNEPQFQAPHLLEVFGLLEFPDVPELLSLLNQA